MRSYIDALVKRFVNRPAFTLDGFHFNQGSDLTKAIDTEVGDDLNLFFLGASTLYSPARQHITPAN